MAVNNMFTYSGTDVLMDIALENTNNISPFLVCGHFSKAAAEARLHRSEKQISFRQPSMGATTQASGSMATTAYKENIATRVSNRAQKIKSTALQGDLAALVFTDAEMSGESGMDGNESDGYYLKNMAKAKIFSGMSSVARFCDQTMFQHMFAAMEVTTKASGASPVVATKKFVDDVKKSYTMTTDFTGTDSNETKGINIINDFKQATMVSATGSYSLKYTNKGLVIYVPEEYMIEMAAYINLVRKNTFSKGVAQSDGTFDSIHNIMLSVDSINVVGLPHTWFFTTGADDATRSFTALMTTFDAFNPYCPILSENILKFGQDLINPRINIVPSSISNLDFPSWVYQESDSSFGSLSMDDIMAVNDRYMDNTLLTMMKAYEKRHPESRATSAMAYTFKPNSYKIYNSEMPSSTAAMTSYSSVLEIVRWAGGVRVNPHEMCIFNMPCALFNHDLSAYSNTLTFVNVAMQTMPEETVERFLYDHREEVRREIDQDNAKRGPTEDKSASLESKIDEFLKDKGEVKTFRQLETKRVKHVPEDTKGLDRIEEDVKRVLSKAKSSGDVRAISRNTNTPMGA